MIERHTGERAGLPGVKQLYREMKEECCEGGRKKWSCMDGNEDRDSCCCEFSIKGEKWPLHINYSLKTKHIKLYCTGLTKEQDLRNSLFSSTIWNLLVLRITKQHN